MQPNNEEKPPIEDPMAELERQLIHAYLAGAGQDYHALLERGDREAQRILADASEYASSKLSEIEARLHYIRSLHGQA
jgi:hypothetical protein